MLPNFRPNFLPFIIWIFFFSPQKSPMFCSPKNEIEDPKPQDPKPARPRIVQEALDGSRYSSHELSEEHGMMGGCYG